MSKLEKEIKILDVDIKESKERIKKIGATLVEEGLQRYYVYDFPAISSRFLEIKEHLKKLNGKTDIKSLKATRVELTKFRYLLEEVYDLCSPQEEKILREILNFHNMVEAEKIQDEVIKQSVMSSNLLTNIFTSYDINPNKWLRLRQTNGNTTLTCKHILYKNDEKYQHVNESEIQVSDFETANDIITKFGLEHRGFQEKYRIRYDYQGAEIDIDKWPLIPPYIEIECNDDKVIEEIVKKLGYGTKKIVSCNTENVYKDYNIDIFATDNLRLTDADKAEIKSSTSPHTNLEI